MKLKSLALTVLVLGLMAGAALWLERRADDRAAPDPRVGQPLVQAEALRAVDCVRLSGAQGQRVTLQRAEAGHWAVVEESGFPADFPRLARLVDSLQGARVVREVTRQPERLERLELGRARVELIAGNDPVLVVRLGRAEDTGGVFFQYGEQGPAFLLSTNPWIDPVPANWVNRAITGLTAEEVRAIAELDPASGEPRWSAARAEAGAAFELANNPETGQPPAGAPDASKVATLARTLAGLRYTATVAAAEATVLAARPFRRAFRLTAFDGRVLDLSIGRTPEIPAPEPVLPDETLPWEETPADAPLPTAQPAGPVHVWIDAAPAGTPWRAFAATTAFTVGDHVFSQLP